MEKNDRAQNRKIRRIKAWIRAGFVVILIGLAVFVLKSDIFNIKNYVVEGNYYYSDEEIISMGKCPKNVNILYGIDCKDIRERLNRDSYTKDVEISRKLPDTIEIKIQERVQTAALFYGENYVVLDDERIVLRKTTVDPKVTLLKGFMITKMNIGEAAEVEETVLLRQAYDIIRAANENDMYFVCIQLADGELSAKVLNNLTVKGSADKIIEVVKTGELQVVIEKLFEQNIERGVINVSGDNYISFNPKIE